MSKFGPIYDAIDSERYDFAIKICDKAIKKSPKSPENQTIKALKALATVRSGLYQQAYDLAIEVKRTNPTDPHAIQAIFLTLKMLQMHDDIIDLYKTSYTIKPNEEWGNHWFMALARKGDWKQAQQQANKFHKEFQQEKYFFWMIMTVYLQAIDPDNKNGSILLKLVDKMLEKAMDEGKIFNFESI
jgi:N-terminal acetyltransferase B complex non-catalytic subunit